MTEKIYAFIDSQNLNLGIKDQGWDLDFNRFYVYLKEKYKTSRIFLFIGFIQKNVRLYNYLSSIGYILIFKPILLIKNTNHIKGNVDAELVLQAMIEYNKYDKAVIVSGDGDFHCLIDYLRKKNKLEVVIIPNRKKYSQLLLNFSEYLRFMNDLKEKLGKKNGSVALRTKP
ncbi:MAG: NYN domain-containing protein [bacterium]|nr:NYN domain-containing protein [bacterium]